MEKIENDVIVIDNTNSIKVKNYQNFTEEDDTSEGN